MLQTGNLKEKLMHNAKAVEGNNKFNLLSAKDFHNEGNGDFSLYLPAIQHFQQALYEKASGKAITGKEIDSRFNDCMIILRIDETDRKAVIKKAGNYNGFNAVKISQKMFKEAREEIEGYNEEIKDLEIDLASGVITKSVFNEKEGTLKGKIKTVKESAVYEDKLIKQVSLSTFRKNVESFIGSTLAKVNLTQDFEKRDFSVDWSTNKNQRILKKAVKYLPVDIVNEYKQAGNVTGMKEAADRAKEKADSEKASKAQTAKPETK